MSTSASLTTEHIRSLEAVTVVCKGAATSTRLRVLCAVITILLLLGCSAALPDITGTWYATSRNGVKHTLTFAEDGTGTFEGWNLFGEFGLPPSENGSTKHGFVWSLEEIGNYVSLVITPNGTFSSSQDRLLTVRTEHGLLYIEGPTFGGAYRRVR